MKIPALALGIILGLLFLSLVANWELYSVVQRDRETIRILRETHNLLLRWASPCGSPALSLERQPWIVARGLTEK